MRSRARPWRRRGSPRGTGGFTLVELLIVLTVVPIIVGALSLGLIMIFSLQNGVSSRLYDAGDAQVVSSTYIKDVQSAQMITELSSLTIPGSTLACGAGMTYTSTPVQLLALEWGGSGGSYANVVSYVTEQNPGLSSYSLYRQFCSGGVTSVAADVTTVATDLSPGGASSLPSISCASAPVDQDCTKFAASPPAPDATTPLYETTWINAGDVASVLLSVQEHALLPAPNSNTPFQLTLAASPRIHQESPTHYQGGGTSPITVLGQGCSTPSFDITNNVTVSINVGGGSGNGSLGLNAKNCPTVRVDNGGTLLAGSILTTNPNLNSVYNYPSGTTYPVPEYFTDNVVDPFKGLAPPSTSATGLSPGGCSQSGSTWTCTAGDYTFDPGTLFGNGANQTINFQTTGCGTIPDPNSCRFLFEQGLSLPGQSSVSFATGIYVYEGGTSGTAITANPGVSINAALTGGSQVLFYIASGSASFAPGITINMAGLDEYMGVTLWDADTANPLVIGNNSNGGAFAGYGGIYVPNQGVQVNNDKGGTLTVSFIVADSLTFKQNLTLNVTQ